MKNNMPSISMWMMLFMWIINFIACMISNFMYLWILMEISTFLFFIMLGLSKSPSFKVMAFFILQSVSSIMILWLYKHGLENNLFIKLAFLLIIMLKLGLAPFSFWPPILTKNFSWMLIFTFSTLQKFIPLLILNSFFYNFFNNGLKYIFLLCILTLLMSTIMALFCLNMKMMMAYSSINNSSWMILLMLTDFYSFIMFFLIYTFITYLLCKILTLLKWDSFNDLPSSIIYSHKKEKVIFTILCSLMSIAMIPPFSSFIIKMNAILIMLFSNNLILPIIMMTLSTLSILMYINMSLKSLTFLMVEYKFSIASKKTLNKKFMNYYKLATLIWILSIFLMITIIF